MSIPPADPKPCGASRRPRLLHLTTTDMSLELLLGPQLEAFLRAGYDVHATSAPGAFVDAITKRGVTFHPLEHSTRSVSPLADLRAGREFFQLVKRLKPDIVHTHNPKPGVYGRVAAKLARVPLIVNTVHGLYAQPTDRLAKRAVVYTLERVAAACSDVELVQNSEDLLTLRQLRIPGKRLRELGNGVDLARFSPATPEDRLARRADLGIAPDNIVVGAVGRLVEEKGYIELLDAFRTVSAKFPEATLVIIGPHEPDKADALDNDLMARAKEEGVLFLGHKDDVHNWYGAMDIYVLASHREGFPRSAMEAAASGLPVVATDIRGCRQVVDHGVTGHLVPVRNADALAAALVDLVGNAASRTRMGAAGLAKAKHDFDQQQVIELTLQTYNQLQAGSA